MKKLLFTLSLILSLTFIFSACSTTFDGYSYNLDDARKNESSIYEEYDYFLRLKAKGITLIF